MSSASVLDTTDGAGYLGPDLVRRAGARAVGRALTVRTGAGDNLALHRAVAQAAPGDVIVVSCPGPPVGLAGEIICRALTELGAAGLVTDSGVRDLDELRDLGFPVWSAAVVPVGTAKRDQGQVGEPVDINGVQIRPGDIVIADGDGVVCVPAEAWDTVSRAAQRKQEGEARWMAQLGQGARLESLTGLVAVNDESE